MVANTSELLPEPETPVNTVSRRFGISTCTSLRLFSRAPSTRIKSWLSATCCADDCLFVVVAVLIVSPSFRRRPVANSVLLHRLLHKGGDPYLFGCGQFRQREGGRPHVAFVEVRRGVEAERRVPLLELRRRCEEADDLAVAGGVGRHPVPGLRHKVRRTLLDDLVEPLGHCPIRFFHLVDLGEHVSFPVRLLLVRLQLLSALLHRGSFFIAESLGRGAALGGRLGGLLCRHRFLLRSQRSWSSPRTLPSGSVTVATRRPPPTSRTGSFTLAPAAVTSASFASMSGTCQ